MTKMKALAQQCTKPDLRGTIESLAYNEPWPIQRSSDWQAGGLSYLDLSLASLGETRLSLPQLHQHPNKANPTDSSLAVQFYISCLEERIASSLEHCMRTTLPACELLLVPEDSKNKDQLEAASWQTELAQDKLRRMEQLKDGWDSYSAPAPSIDVINRARAFLRILKIAKYFPDAVRPSVVGGVGITLREGDSMAYIEFLNDGNVLLLLTDGEDEDTISEHATNDTGYLEIVDKIRTYMNA